MDQQQLSTAEILKELQEQNRLMRELGTREGFYAYYFKELGKSVDGRPLHRTNYECFDHVNQLYQELFGEERFSGYHSFVRSYTHYIATK